MERKKGRRNEKMAEEAKSAEKTNGVKVTMGGLRPPRLIKRSVDQADIVWFLKAYDEYERKMNIAEEDGMERSKAGLRELVTSTVLRMIARNTTKARKEQN